MHDEKPPTKYELSDYELPGLEKLIETGEVKIQLEINFEMDAYLQVPEGGYQRNEGDLQLSSFISSDPYDVVELLGSQEAVVRFLIAYLQMTVNDGLMGDQE